MGQIEQLVKSKLLGNDNPNNLVWPITKTQAVYDKTNTDLQTVLDSLGSEIQEIKEINNVSVRYDQVQELTEEQKETARNNIDAGTYSKPEDGIPASDLDSEIQTSLEKADSSLQSIKTFASQNLSGSGDAVRKHTMEIVSESQPRCVLFYGQTKSYTALVSVPSANFSVLVCASGSTGVAYDYSDCVDAWGPAEDGHFMMLRFKTGSNLSIGDHDVFVTFLSGNFGDDTVNIATGGIPRLTTALTVVNYYQKPSTGIPASDLAWAVQQSLWKVDNAVIKADSNFYELDVEECVVMSSASDASIIVFTSGDDDGTDFSWSEPIFITLGTDSYKISKTNADSNSIKFYSGSKDGEWRLALYNDSAEYQKTVYVLEVAGELNVQGVNILDDAFDNTPEEITSRNLYALPATGIPASDLASGVIPTVPAISTNITTDASSNTKTASPKAVKDYVDSKAIEIVTYGTSVSEIPSAPLCYVSRSDVLDIIPDAGGADDQITSEPGVYLTRQDYSDAEENVRYSGIYSYYTFESSASVHRICIITALYNAGDWELEVHDLYDEIHPTVASSQPSGGFVPNIMYNLGTLSGNTTFALATPADANIVNHYFWTFDTPATAPTITWPSGISWFGGSAPTINASKHYEISVLNGIGVAMEV